MTESTMLERVARAAYEAEPRGGRWSDVAVKWEGLTEVERAGWSSRARAALEAIGEPSDDLVIIGGWALSDESGAGNKAAAAWSAMIDSILSEQPDKQEG